MDRYNIFLRDYHRRLMKNLSTPQVDAAVDLMNEVLNDRAEIGLRFKASIQDLRDVVISQAEIDNLDDTDIMIKVLELMFDEMFELHIDDCFVKEFEPPKPDKKREGHCHEPPLPNDSE